MKFLITLSLIVTAIATQAQNNFLTIFQTENTFEQLNYPPGTKFELKDSNGELVFSDKSENGTFKINAAYTLTVYPSWKETTDVFELSSGRLELRPPIKMTEFYDKDTDNGRSYQSNGVTVEKTLSDSKKLNGKKNVILTFSNGVVFTYTDGDYKATLDGKELEIKSKYLIYSKLGIHKLSFNPINGVVYWVFEPHS